MAQHAVAMAQFAHECMVDMKRITRQLEKSLGAGTNDLDLRVGLHSGPVIAGVLRGERARFQVSFSLRLPCCRFRPFLQLTSYWSLSNL